MNVIGHDGEGMHLEVIQPGSIVVDGLHDDQGNFRQLKPEGAFFRPVECGVHGLKRGGVSLGTPLVGRETPVETERDENRVSHEVKMGQVTTVESHGYLRVGFQRGSSHIFFREKDLMRKTGRGARPTRRGVTLLEMLVVVAIVAIMMGVSYPSISASVDSVRLATAADSTAAFLNSALNRAEQRHQVLELTIAKKQNQIALRSADPTFLRKLELPSGIRIGEVLPTIFAGEEEARVFYLIPGGAAPRVGVQLVNIRGAKRTVRVDPITGAPEIVRE